MSPAAVLLLTTILALPPMAWAVPSAASAQTLPPPGASAQTIQHQIDASGKRSAIIRRLQASGLTPAEIRQRLAAMGYDPTTLDPYLTDDGEPAVPPTQEVVLAAEALDALPQPTTGALAELAIGREPSDSSALEKARGLRVFGLEVFRRSTSQFQPVTAGPVPAGYRVGPGDELVLILTGDVERSYTLPVAREGFVVIPQVGQVWVNGLTLDEVRARLYTHLGQA